MLLRLETKDQHTECTRCNYLGCTFARQTYGPALGHWIWTLELVWSQVNRYGPRAVYRRAKRWWTELDYSKIEDVEVDGIDTRDYPDFTDAFISSATYKGREMTDAELDRLNEDSDFVYKAVQDRLY